MSILEGRIKTIRVTATVSPRGIIISNIQKYLIYYAVKFKGASSFLLLSCAVCNSALACVIALACAIVVASIYKLLACVTVLTCLFQDRSRSGKSKKQMRNEAVEMIGRDTQHSSYLLSNRGHLLTKRPSLVPTFNFWFHFSASATWNGPIGEGIGSPS